MSAGSKAEPWQLLEKHLQVWSGGLVALPCCAPVGAVSLGGRARVSDCRFTAQGGHAVAL